MFPGYNPATPLRQSIHPEIAPLLVPGLTEPAARLFTHSHRFVVTGCVDYKYANFSTPHQTGFIYEVWHVVGDSTEDLIVGEDVDRAHLKLEPFTFGGFFAN